MVKKRRIQPKRTKKIKIVKGDRVIYGLNPDFEFFEEMKNLIMKSSPAEKDRMTRKISSLGRIKLAVVAGVLVSNAKFTSTSDSDVDLFIVGDEINKDKLRAFLKSLEAEVGKEIRFGLMEKDEFEYRYNMFDRFVRVLL